jgi:hypothetical protein
MEFDAGTSQDIIDSKIEMGAMDNAGALQLARWKNLSLYH